MSRYAASITPEKRWQSPRTHALDLQDVLQLMLPRRELAEGVDLLLIFVRDFHVLLALGLRNPAPTGHGTAVRASRLPRC